MRYKSYLNAARKHLKTCEVLLQQAENLNSQKTNDKALQQHLLLNLYYLTGYVFECSIKYGIYKAIKYDPDASVTQLKQANLTYAKHIKHHSFNKYAEHLTTRHAGIKLVDDLTGVPVDIRILYKNWNVEWRYETLKEMRSDMRNKITVGNLSKLLDYANIVFITVERF